MTKDARIALRLTTELREALEQAAQVEMRTMSQMAAVILARALLPTRIDQPGRKRSKATKARR